MGKKLTLKKERWWEKESETKIAIENGETQKKATTELTLQSTSQCSSPFSTVFTYDYQIKTYICCNDGQPGSNGIPHSAFFRILNGLQLNYVPFLGTKEKRVTKLQLRANKTVSQNFCGTLFQKYFVCDRRHP